MKPGKSGEGPLMKTMISRKYLNKAPDGESKHYRKSHLGKSPRCRLEPAPTGFAGNGRARSEAFSPDCIKLSPIDSGTLIDHSGCAVTRRVSPSDTTMNATRRPTTAQNTIKKMEATFDE